MNVAVSLRDLVDEIQMLSNESYAYLNKVTGKVIRITNDDVAMAEIVHEIEAELEDADDKTMGKSRIWRHKFTKK